MRLETYSNTADIFAWKDFKMGSKRAYLAIYQKYAPALYNYSRHICQDKELVKDCIQEVFIKIWVDKEKLGDVNNIKFYLFQCLRRRLIAEISSQKKTHKNNLLHNSDFEVVCSHEYCLIREQTTIEEQENILKAINTLSKRQKEIIFLKFYNGLSYKEVAVIMGLNIDSTYNVMTKAIGILKKKLQEIKHDVYAP